MVVLDIAAIFTEVKVCYPSVDIRETSCTGGQLHKYGINIVTNDPAYSLNHSLVWRRYSEFCWLRKALKENNCTLEVPNLPPHGYFQNRDHPLFLENRRLGLETFIKECLKNPLFKADRALHLFLQTSLSLTEISENLLGMRHDEICAFQDNLPTSQQNEYFRIERSVTSAVMAVPEETAPSQKPLDQIRDPYHEYEKFPEYSQYSMPIAPKSPKRVTFCEQVKNIESENVSLTTKYVQ